MTRAGSTKRILIALAALALSLVAAAHAGESFAIRARRIVPVSSDLPRVIENGVMVVRDGRITAIGRDVQVPLDLRLLEFPDSTVIPGLVAAVSNLGHRHSGDESVAAGYRAADSLDLYGNHARLLAAGVTTVHADPGSHRLVTGQGVVAKLGGPPTDRILRAQADLAVNLGAGVFNPPEDVTYPFPASADVEIVPGRRQRPASRIDQLLGLEEAIRDALAGKQYQQFSLHPRALAEAWQQQLPLRIRADRAADMLAAIELLQKQNRKGYVVGGAEFPEVADQLREAKVPLVYQAQDQFRSPGSNIGRDPAAKDDPPGDLQALKDIRFALAPPVGGSVGDLRLAAVRASGAGLGRARALCAITRDPATILGVADRVGSLDPGRDADFVVCSSDPLDLSAHIRQVYINGYCVFQPPLDGPLVVKAGTIWAGPGNVIPDGEVLIENGKIVDVGRSVPRPPLARMIDAGPDAFVTPGLIDSHSHLGLHGDTSPVANDVRLSKLIGVADVTDLRVCRAGITTVVLSPYLSSGTATRRIMGSDSYGRPVYTTQTGRSSGASSSMGSPAVAVKTAGRRRDFRVIRDPAVVLFDVSQADPLAVQETLKKPLDAGKTYLDKWTKYEKELKEFLEKKEKGESAEKGKESEQEESTEDAKADPITGTWQATVAGGPLPEPVSMRIAVRLIGSNVEGQIASSSMGVTGRISGTFGGKHLSATIEVDIPGVNGSPQLEADLVEEDHFKGTVTVMDMSVPIDGRRIDKRPVDLKVTRTRRTRGKDGRPLPPKVDESLEPLKSLLEKKIPAVVKVATAAQIQEVLALLVDKHELPLVLLDAQGAAVHSEKLAEKKVTVVVPPTVLRTRQYRDYHQADVLALRRGPDRVSKRC